MSPRLLAIATLSVAAVLAALLLGGDRQSAVGAGGVERATPAASEPAERPDDGPTADVPSELVPSRREAEADSTTPPDEPSSTPAAASAEAPPPVIPEGTALTGTLVDAEGSPVAEAVLELSANGRRRDVRVTPDDLGRFAVAVDRHGELGVAAIADGIGRSADLTRTVPEGVTTDLGVLRLLGDGRLAGRVVFPGGEPFPGVRLSARAVDKAASPGLRRANMRTDDDGRFSLTALAPGPFRLTAFGEDPLPVNGNDTFQSGDEDVELVVDATLIRARCVDAAGSTVPMKGIEIATISLESSTEHDVTGMTSFGFKRERDGHSFMIAPGLPYRLQATDAEYRSYFAVLTGDLRAGIHDVDLMEDAPGLGSLRVVLPPSGAGEGAQLTIGDLQRDGEDVMGGMVMVSGNAADGCTAEQKGLLPGSYTATIRLQGDDWSALETEKHAFEIVAGAQHRIDVNAFVGGRIELRVGVLGDESEEETRLRAKVRVLAAGSTEGSWLQVTSKRKGGATVYGSRLFADRTPARSDVLRPGTYDVEVESEGFRTLRATATVVAGAATDLQLDLERE